MKAETISAGMEHAMWLVVFIATCAGLMKGLSTWRNNHYETRKQRDKNEELLISIHKELHPNGGASLADQVRRIEEGIKENKKSIEGTNNRIDNLYHLFTEGAEKYSTYHTDVHDDGDGE